MLDLSSEVKAIYESDAYTGHFKFTIGDDEYDSTHMKGGTLEITESLCSTASINFSATEKGELKVTLGNLNHTIEELKGKTITIVQTIEGTDVPLGVYTIVDSQNKTTNFIDIQAFDNLHKLDIDISDWWNSEVSFPITIRNLLLALLTHCNVEHNIPQTFTNSNYTIAQNVLFEGVTGLELLGYIQEISACFIKPDRYGVFRIIQLPTMDWSEYGYAHTYSVAETVKDLKIADFITEKITKVQVRGNSDDVGIIVGTGDNSYIIESNLILTYITDSTVDRQMVNNILTAVSNIQYRPFGGTFKGLPFIEVGDMIKVNTITDMTGYGILLQRTLHGSGIRRDKIEIQGTEQQESVKSTNREVRVLRQQTHELVNTVDEFRSTISSMEETLDNSVTGYSYYWLVNDGETPTKDTEGWSQEDVAWEIGKHKWQMVVTQYVNRPNTYQITDLTEPNLLDIETWYYLSTSDTEIEDEYLYFTETTYFGNYTFFVTPIGAEWTKEKPEPIVGHFLWTRFKKIFSDGTVQWTDPVVDKEFNATYTLIHRNTTSIEQTNERIALKADTETVLSQYNALSNEIEQERVDRHSEIVQTSEEINLGVSKALSGKASSVQILHIAVDAGVIPTPDMEGWTDGTVVKGTNQRVWQITKTVTTDPEDMTKEVTVYSGLADITGAQGESGANAASSEVYDQKIRYIASNNGTTVPSASADWKTTVSATGIVEGQYLWTWTWIQWGHKNTDNEWVLDVDTNSYSVSYWSKDGAKGEKGDDGKYVVSRAYRYRTSVSTETYDADGYLYFKEATRFNTRTYFSEPISSDNAWSDSRPSEFVAGHYLWVEETDTYSDGSTTVTYTCDPAVIATYDIYAYSKADIDILDDSVSIWANRVTDISNAFNEYKTEESSRLSVLSNQILSEVSASYQTIEGMNLYSKHTEVKSMINQLANSIELKVENSQGRSTGISIKLIDLDGNEQKSSGTITLSGDVIFKSNLTDGTTTISGNNIKTGTIDASRISTTIARTNQIPTNVSELTNDSNYVNSANAVAEEQYVYISKASGTSSVSKPSAWITQAGNVQNTWSTKRPVYNTSYPLVFIAKQKKMVNGTVSCTTPVRDDTTTVIDGGRITTGTIDAIDINGSNITGSTIKFGSGDYAVIAKYAVNKYSETSSYGGVTFEGTGRAVFKVDQFDVWDIEDGAEGYKYPLLHLSDGQSYFGIRNQNLRFFVNDISSSNVAIQLVDTRNSTDFSAIGIVNNQIQIAKWIGTKEFNLYTNTSNIMAFRSYDTSKGSTLAQFQVDLDGTATIYGKNTVKIQSGDTVNIYSNGKAVFNIGATNDVIIYNREQTAYLWLKSDGKIQYKSNGTTGTL